MVAVFITFFMVELRVDGGPTFYHLMGFSILSDGQVVFFGSWLLTRRIDIFFFINAHGLMSMRSCSISRRSYLIIKHVIEKPSRSIIVVSNFILSP